MNLIFKVTKKLFNLIFCACKFYVAVQITYLILITAFNRNKLSYHEATMSRKTFSLCSGSPEEQNG
jgi:hypothetical protein